MRVLLLGGDGQVGHELAAAMGLFAEVVAPSRRDADLAELVTLRRLAIDARPDLIVNAAAFTDVDGAERAEAVAETINGDAVGVLGEVAKICGGGLVHLSTDFVFDGTKNAPYVEGDTPAPLSAYGRSKLKGERALEALNAPAIVLRTAWVYSLRRKSFVSAILRAARERETLRVVSDQIGSPTFCRDLAMAVALLVHAHRGELPGLFSTHRGVYHVAGTGFTSRYDLALAALALDPRKDQHKVTTVEPIPTSAYPLPAARPAFAPLDSSLFAERFGIRLPLWRESLARAVSASGY